MVHILICEEVVGADTERGQVTLLDARIGGRSRYGSFLPQVQRILAILHTYDACTQRVLLCMYISTILMFKIACACTKQLAGQSIHTQQYILVGC